MNTIEITRPIEIKNYIINNDNFKFKYIDMDYLEFELTTVNNNDIALILNNIDDEKILAVEFNLNNDISLQVDKTINSIQLVKMDDKNKFHYKNLKMEYLEENREKIINNTISLNIYLSL